MICSSLNLLVFIACSCSEDDTYEFDMPFAKAQAMEGYEPGKCRKCGAPIQMHLKRTQQRQ